MKEEKGLGERNSKCFLGSSYSEALHIFSSPSPPHSIRPLTQREREFPLFLLFSIIVPLLLCVEIIREKSQNRKKKDGENKRIRNGSHGDGKAHLELFGVAAAGLAAVRCQFPLRGPVRLSMDSDEFVNVFTGVRCVRGRNGRRRVDGSFGAADDQRCQRRGPPLPTSHHQQSIRSNQFLGRSQGAHGRPHYRMQRFATLPKVRRLLYNNKPAVG